MLTFNLKKKWFDKIKSGEKTHEYRLVNDYWYKRLSTQWEKYMSKGTGIPCCFACGYPKREDKQNRLYGKIKSIAIILDGINTELATYEPVYDIKFELIDSGARDDV